MEFFNACVGILIGYCIVLWLATAVLETIYFARGKSRWSGKRVLVAPWGMLVALALMAAMMAWLMVWVVMLPFRFLLRLLTNPRKTVERLIYPLGRTEFFRPAGRETILYVSGDRKLYVSTELRCGKRWFDRGWRAASLGSVPDNWLPPHEVEKLTFEERLEILRKLADYAELAGQDYRIEAGDKPQTNIT